MKQTELNRLNDLFEKMLSSNANRVERRELTHLYQEYIDDGRENAHSIKRSAKLKQAVLN